MRRLLRLLLFVPLIVAVVLSHPTLAGAAEEPTAAQRPRSVNVAYALAFAGTLAPIYASKAIADRDDGPGSGLPWGARVAALAGLCAGPSLGYAYGGSWGYALVSASAKAAILGAAIWADSRADGAEERHAWLSTFAAIGVVGWTVVDFIRLGPFVRENNRAQTARQLAIAPLVSARGGLSAGLVGGTRF